MPHSKKMEESEIKISLIKLFTAFVVFYCCSQDCSIILLCLILSLIYAGQLAIIDATINKADDDQAPDQVDHCDNFVWLNKFLEILWVNHRFLIQDWFEMTIWTMIVEEIDDNTWSHYAWKCINLDEFSIGTQPPIGMYQ